MPRAHGQAGDEALLDELFDRAVALLEEGRTVDVEALAGDRPDLRRDVERIVRLAQGVAVVRTEAAPAIAGYGILSELGAGGMGTVYLARQERLGGRPVALKVLPPSAALSARARQRFLNEANAIAKLRHPNIVAIHDVVQDGRTLAYAMEWIEARSLAQLIAGADRAAASFTTDACRIGVAVARALGVVHCAGLVHRDVKPSNILLRPDGTPLLSDFGLVRETETTVHTQDGQFIGTAAYAAPEQLRGETEAIDGRADVYALGVTLYHAIAGQLPFEGRSAAGILARVESGLARPLRRARPGVPRDLETIIAKAMAPEPDARYPTADELADDLERLVNLEPIRARPAGPLARSAKLLRRNKRVLAGAVVGGVAALALAVTLGVYWFLLPGWAQARLDEARLALLDPLHSDIVFFRYTFGNWNESQPRPPAFPAETADAALPLYNAAMRLAPTDRDVRLERDTVRLADDVSRSPTAPPAPSPALRRSAPVACAYAREWTVTGRPAAAGDDALRKADAADLRCLGLLAVLCHDVPTALRAWAQLDLRHEPDALVEAYLGLLYLRLDQPARAYPRLRNACRAYPDAGFLMVSLAEAAVHSGDVAKAEQWLEQARSMPRLDTTGGWDRVHADVLAASGRDGEARALYERLLPANPATVDSYGRYLESRGEWRAAMDLYVRWLPGRQQLHPRLVNAADCWWDSLSGPQRWRIVRASLDDPRRRAGSFFHLLRAYHASRKNSRVSAAPEGRDSAPFSRRLTLAALAQRMEITNMPKWNRIRNYPRFLKTLQFRAWLVPDHAQTSRAIDRVHAIWAALILGAATTGGAQAGDTCPPTGLNLLVEEYVTGLELMQQFSFASDGNLYVGHGSNDPAQYIRRVPPGGGSYENFGDEPIQDPDSVLVDIPGSVATAGSVLVGYIQGSNGHLKAINPTNGSIGFVFSNSQDLTNPERLQLDINDRLLISDATDFEIYEIVGGTPGPDDLLIAGASPQFTTGCDDRIYVLDWADGGIDVYDLDGIYIETLAEGLGSFSRIACSSGGDFGAALYASKDGSLFQIDPVTGDAEEIGQGGFSEIAFDTAGALYMRSAQTIFRITIDPDPCAWDCDGSADGVVGILDFLALLGQWGECGTSCDFGAGGAGIGIEEFLELLANWGPCP